MECADNREVIATAMEMKDGLDMEIWDHKRFVIRLTLSPFRGTSRPPNEGRPTKARIFLGGEQCPARFFPDV